MNAVAVPTTDNKAYIIEGPDHAKGRYYNMPANVAGVAGRFLVDVPSPGPSPQTVWVLAKCGDVDQVSLGGDLIQGTVTNIPSADVVEIDGVFRVSIEGVRFENPEHGRLRANPPHMTLNTAERYFNSHR
jgi:hypothetical protein